MTNSIYLCMKNIKRKKVNIDYVNYDYQKEAYFINTGNDVLDYFFSDLINNSSKCVKMVGRGVLDNYKSVEIGKELIKLYESTSNKK